MPVKTMQLWGHMQNFVLIILLQFGWAQYEYLINSWYKWKSFSEMVQWPTEKPSWWSKTVDHIVTKKVLYQISYLSCEYETTSIHIKLQWKTMGSLILIVEKVNLFSAGSSYIWDLDFVITVSADGLAPNGARPSAGTVLATPQVQHVFCQVPTAYHQCSHWRS